MTSHQGENGDFAIEGGRSKDGRISRTPGYFKAPLRWRIQLAEDFTARNVAVGIPAQNFGVLAARKKKVGILEKFKKSFQTLEFKSLIGLILVPLFRTREEHILKIGSQFYNKNLCFKEQKRTFEHSKRFNQLKYLYIKQFRITLKSCPLWFIIVLHKDLLFRWKQLNYTYWLPSTLYLNILRVKKWRKIADAKWPTDIRKARQRVKRKYVLICKFANCLKLLSQSLAVLLLNMKTRQNLIPLLGLGQFQRVRIKAFSIKL